MKSRAGARVAARFAALERRIADAAADGVGDGNHRIAVEVEGRAPRLTGGLADSVAEAAVSRDGDVVSARVVVHHPGVASVEYGDRDQAPEPFLRPGFDAGSPGARGDIIARIKGACRD